MNQCVKKAIKLMASPFFQVIVLWTANTERFCDECEGLNDTAENLLKSISRNEEEVSPSTIFAVASILEKVTKYFNLLNFRNFLVLH